MTPAPPSPFPDINRVELPAGESLHRIHSSDFAGTSFNPCRGQPSRFAPIRRPDATCIPTAYAAQSFECATHETVFHDIPYDAKNKSIAFSKIEMLTYSILRARRSLTLASLREPDLNKWGLRRQDLIDTFPTAYAATALWAAAIHAADANVDGMVWTSRRCDPFQAYVLFGDRVRLEDLEIIGSEKIADSPLRLAEIRGFAARANILISM